MFAIVVLRKDNEFPCRVVVVVNTVRFAYDFTSR